MLSFFPLDVLDEIWDVIDSVSEGFLIYSLTNEKRQISLHCLRKKLNAQTLSLLEMSFS